MGPVLIGCDEAGGGAESDLERVDMVGEGKQEVEKKEAGDEFI